MEPSHAPGRVSRSLLQPLFQQLQNGQGTRADEPLVGGKLILEAVEFRLLRRKGRAFDRGVQDRAVRVQIGEGGWGRRGHLSRNGAT